MLFAFGSAALVIAFVILWKEAAVKHRARRFSKLIGAAAGVFVGALLLLTATGRLHWLAALGTAMLPLLRWLLSLIAAPLIGNWLRSAFRGGTRPDPAQTAGPATSTVATADLRMTLEHETGAMDGEVLTGPFAGQRLSQLDKERLERLRAGFAAADSLQLLDAYMDRRFPGWRDAAAGASNGAADANASAMGQAQALAVLGLNPGATKTDILAAHRRLMQKLHPDRGGSDYLAATLNRAKDVLLDNDETPP